MKTSALDHLPKPLSRALVEVHALRTLARAGMLSLESPRKLRAIKRALDTYGTVGGAITVAAVKHGEHTALVDEIGPLSYTELDQRSNALANAWRAWGIRPGDVVGILCRNHRGLLDATFAANKLGTRAIFLNTDFAAPQLRDVCAREGVQLLVYDEEYTSIAQGIDTGRDHVLAWTDSEAAGPTLEKFIAEGDPTPPPPPGQKPSVVLLTSGTTGTPKGAPRHMGASLAIPGGFVSKVPYRPDDVIFIGAPVFHGWGLLNTLVALAMGATVVFRRRFEPEKVLTDLTEHCCTALVVVPVMLHRLLALGGEKLRTYDLSALHIIAVSGSQLPGELALRTMDAFGDVVYNMYGSTEVSYATFATPEDVRAAPDGVGRPPFGTRIRILDEKGHQLPTGQIGRVFVASPLSFTGYTGGGSKEVIGGFMSTGDVGHLDSAGRLFIDGRDDEMIVSGGENVFPHEVEELLVTHEAIDDAAAVGVADETFGKRLRAFVVRKPGSELTAEEVQAFVKDNLARYKVPRDVVFLDELPRNPSGKVLKRELLRMDGEGVR